jgi:hypothetical protein
MVMSQESSHSPKIRRGEAGWLWPVVMGVAAAAYCLGLRRYGIELADEGALLAHMDRVAHGQVPYRDFHVGYGPALYWMHVPLFTWWGASIGTVRAGLAIVHGLRAAMLARLAGVFGGGGWAVAAVLALIGFFLPVAPGVCAPGNIPYPAWYADAVGLLAVLLFGRQRAPALAIGVLWGIAFAFRQNTGVLGLGAAAVTIVLAGDPTAGARRGVGAALALALIAGAVVLLHEFLDALLVGAFVVPLLPLVVALAGMRTGREVATDLIRLGIGFAAAAGAAVGVMVAQAGPGAVWTDFLQIGTDTVRVYHAGHPTLADVMGQLDGADAARSVRVLADGAWFAVFPLAHLTATALVASGRIRSRPAIAVVVAATLGYLQLFPRMDFWHLMSLAPASLASLTIVAATLGPGIARVVAGLLAVTAVGRLTPALPVIAASMSMAPSPPPVARVDVRWDLLRDEAVRRFPEVVEAVRGRRRVAGFPALGLVNFALGEPSPWRHDYFFPGRPTLAEEQALIAATMREPPEAVVVLESPEGPFEAAAAAHPAIVAMLDRNFTEVRRIGPYRILVPRRAP